MLRKRLYSGLLPLLTLLVILNVAVVLQIRNLDDTVERIQLENYRSILSLRDLSMSASNLTAASLFAQNGLEDQAALTARNGVDAMRRQLKILRSEATSEQEQGLVEALEQTGGRLLTLFEDYLAGGPRPSPSQVQELVSSLGRRSDRLIDYNRTELLQRAAAVRQRTKTSNFAILLGTGFAIFAALVFWYIMSRQIIAPIEEVTQSARQIADGNLDVTLEKEGPDEIGELSRVFNHMIVQLRNYRRLTDRKLLRSRRRMAEFMDSSPDAIFFVNASKDTTYKNPRARRLWDSLGWYEGLPEELSKDIDHVLSEGSAVISADLGSALVFAIEGRRYAFLPLVIPLESEESEGREAAVVLQDVSKMRLANDLKSNLLATVSHEIKTPLTSARMSLYLVLDGALGEVDPKQRDLLETTRGDLERLLTLLNNILDFARLEAGVAQMKLQATNPHHLLMRVRNEFNTAATAQKIKLDMQAPDDLPQVPVDRQRIQVVLANFVSNALKHSPQSGTVHIYARRDGGSVRFGVSDEGPGVPEDVRHRIFERFVSTSSDKSGSGLGLSISREIVVAHGGSVGYDNTNGSEFFFLLPIVESADLEPEQEQRA